MKTSRRTFLASLLATILGRALVRKPAAPIAFTRWSTQAIKWAPHEAPETGLSIRMIRTWDKDLGRFTVRMDCLWGLQAERNAFLSSQLEVMTVRG